MKSLPERLAAYTVAEVPVDTRTGEGSRELERRFARRVQLARDAAAMAAEHPDAVHIAGMVRP